MLTPSRQDRTFAYLAVLPACLGLANYTGLLWDEDFWRVLLNNFIFLISVPLILLASLVCAVLIYEQVWGWQVFRVIFFVPSVISSVVIGLLFRNFFSFDGPVNQLLGSFGMAPIDWMSSGSTAIVV